MSNKTKSLEDRGLLSGVHNPIWVILYGLGMMVASAVLVFNLVYLSYGSYGLELTHMDVESHRRYLDAKLTGLLIVLGAGGVAGACALIMKLYKKIITAFIIPVVVMAGVYIYNHQNLQAHIELYEAKAAADKAYREAVSATSKHFEGFCDNPQGDSKAKAFKKSASRGHRMASYGSYLSDKEPWISARVKDTELVLCMNLDKRVMDSCVYEGGVSLSVINEHMDVKLYAARTGELLLDQRLSPNNPSTTCPGMVTSYNYNNPGDIVSSYDRKELIAALDPFLGAEPERTKIEPKKKRKKKKDKKKSSKKKKGKKKKDKKKKKKSSKDD